VSLSNWRQAQPTSHYAGLGAYRDLAHDAQFRLTLAHLLIFTIVFALGTLIIGWTLALLLDKASRARASSAPSTSSRWRSRSSLRDRLALADEPGAG